MGDRIVALKDGRLVAHDNSAELLTPETLSAIYDTPFDVLSHEGRPIVIAR